MCIAQSRLVFLSLALAACTGPVGDDGSTPGELSGPGGQLPTDLDCAATPTVDRVNWNHLASSIIARESTRHRITDLISTAMNPNQSVAGRIAYGVEGKSLEDEQVQIFACLGGVWSSLGITTTDDEGRFEVGTLLPIGMRSLSVVVLGDGTSAEGVALVAKRMADIAISDVDGTLTSSENAFPESELVTHEPVAPNDGAPAALSTIVSRGYPIVYVTSRGDYYTQQTRDWLSQNGFPLGPVRLNQPFITLPGADTVEYKSSVFLDLVQQGLVPAIGIGNRASDQMAYSMVSVSPTRTFLKLPEFAAEVQPLIDQGLAVGVPSYVIIQPTFAALPIAP
jgi:hypothetical protein